MEISVEIISTESTEKSNLLNVENGITNESHSHELSHELSHEHEISHDQIHEQSHSHSHPSIGSHSHSHEISLPLSTTSTQNSTQNSAQNSARNHSDISSEEITDPIQYLMQEMKALKNHVSFLEEKMEKMQLTIDEQKRVIKSTKKTDTERMNEHQRLIDQLWKLNKKQQESAHSLSVPPSVEKEKKADSKDIKSFGYFNLTGRKKSWGFGESDPVAKDSPPSPRLTLTPDISDKDYYFLRAGGSHKWKSKLGEDVTLEDKKVTTISRVGLNKLLTNNFGSSEFFDLFFVYHEACITAKDLFDLFINVLKETNDQLRRIVVFNFDIWSRQNPFSFTTILPLLQENLTSLGPDSEAIQNLLKVTINNFKNREEDGQKKLSELIAKEAPEYIDKRFVSHLNQGKTEVKFALVDPAEFARQITLAEQSYLKKIPFSELVNKTFEKQELTPNINNYSKFIDFINAWVLREIFVHPIDGQKQRIKTITQFIDIAFHLKSMKSYNCMCIITAMLAGNPKISALEKSWKALPVLYKNKLSELTNASFDAKLLKSGTPPAIPPISILLRDLTYIEEVGKTWTNSENSQILNFRKMLLVGKTLKCLKDSQDTPYIFKEIPQIHQSITDTNNVVEANPVKIIALMKFEHLEKEQESK